MPRPTRLRMPTLLAIAALGTTTACPDDSEDGSASDDAANSASSGDEQQDCRIADKGDCAAAAGCTWSNQIELCVIDCMPLVDQATCDAAEFCEWTGEACEHHAI